MGKEKSSSLSVFIRFGPSPKQGRKSWERGWKDRSRAFEDFEEITKEPQPPPSWTKELDRKKII